MQFAARTPSPVSSVRQHKHSHCHFFRRDLNHCNAITVDTVMTAHEASSSSSSESKLWNYDVFLSFSGEDTRHGFTGNLHATLKDRGFQAYMDEDDLERGEDIKEQLFRAIEESRISIIVFSKMYADSSWCLNELVKIMECKSKLGRHVLPIFYHVDPSHVRKQDGDLAEAFQKHEKDICEEQDDKKREAKQKQANQWREALTRAGNLSGHHLRITDNRREAEVIRKIIEEIIMKWLPRTNELNVAEHPIEIKSRILRIINHLSGGGSNKVVMVGIWGMGGWGKTTAAKAIYNQIHGEFQSKIFLDDIRDATSKHGLVYLQKKLVSAILKSKRQIRSVGEGIELIKQEFQHRRVLLIMDNVDKGDQLNAIAGNQDWFGPGSRIIITTRDKHLLKKVDEIYEVQKLNDGEALKLFSWHAFGNNWPDEGYLQISEKFVSYCKGLPLALKTLGSLLLKRPIEEWESQLETLDPDGEIIEQLKISFQGLTEKQKAIFLDISCFFIGWNKEYVAKVLDGIIDISILCERCLVTIERNVLNMHDLIREMAGVIISEKSPSHPRKWSRLRNLQEVTDVLTNKSSSNNDSFSTVAFANMKKLKFLQLYHVKLDGEYKYLSKELKWLRWYRCHLKSIPDDFFRQDKLVCIDMRFSQLVQVWKGSQSLRRLKIMNLSHSYSLIESPDFSKVPDLKELILENCASLSEIHPFIGQLKNLSLVNLRNCYSLSSLPSDFYKSKSVRTLCLNNCPKFGELHEDLGEMESLEILEAEDTAIRHIPTSIARLKKLTRFSVRFV
ncbi:disease resistance protein RPV1-like isoform X2 [Malus domestica]|uniref:disease resistance protein RPV1-like isoform X2 n=1 Tax=Malus domestica TaxID=3750 RepID=UPI0039754321